MKKDKCIRVLHITEMLSAAGIESFIMNLYRNIDRNKVQFDFMVLRDAKEFYEDEVNSLGGIKYFVHSDRNNTLLRISDESKQIERFLKKKPYDIVHIHYTTPLRAFYLTAAKKAGVKTRIYHSHSAYVSGKVWIKHLVYSFMRELIKKNGTHFFACSKAAARWVYPKSLLNADKVKVIYNGIETSRFSFNNDARMMLRQSLSIREDEFVLIHTGRFTEQKNQSFIIDVFGELKKRLPDSKLLLLGKGDLLEDVKRKVKNSHLDNGVVFLGVKDNVFDYLSAADCFIMPSLYEGLPVAAIEAQCSGLPCVFSKNITDEVKLSNDVAFISLDSPIDKWVNAILKYKDNKRTDNSSLIRMKNYDVSDVAAAMQDFYLKESQC